jgi:c-di-GMP-binding flagellar brake protein YcgR
MTSEDDIGDALTLLAASGDAISMYAPGSREAVLGRILTVDPELPHFVMELNEGEVLRPGTITFVACLPTAKLQFKLHDEKWSTTPGKPHLIPMVFPESCAVQNRRTSERAETPLGANFTAAFSVGETLYEFPISDFSMGGIGLHCSKFRAKGLLRGRKLQDVRLHLGAESVTINELEIRCTRAFRSFLLGEQLHIGCMFTNMAPEAEETLKRVLMRTPA